MSGHDLPANLGDWPRDPYRLLGVRYGVAPRDLKRAYLHLVRRYKPEHHPDQFRHIRQAYETILRHTGARNRAEFSFSGEEPEPVDLAGQEVEGARGEPTRPRQANAPASPTPDDLWALACQGMPELGYQGLRRLQMLRPDDQEVYSRLYWLLVVRPDLDAGRSPQDWLVTGLRSHPRSSRLRELYRREIDDDPAEALSPRVVELLRLEGSSGLVLDVAAWRWQSAQRLGRGALIADDINHLRQSGRAADETTWIHLLITAASHLAWSDNLRRSSVSDYCAEIERLSHLHTELDDVLLQFDYNLAVADGWIALKRIPGIPDSLIKLLPASRNRRAAEVAPLLNAFLAQVALTPQPSLGVFDLIGKRTPAVLSRLTELFDDFHDEVSFVPDPRSPADLAGPILGFLAASPWWDYPTFRPQLLTFSLREAIAPATVAELARNQANLATADQHLADRIASDWPLHHIYTACELFWG